MKKILAMWSMVSVLILSASANAVELRCTTAKMDCKTMGYIYSDSDVTKLSAEWDCTACPLDATKWACVNKVGSKSTPTQKCQASGYTLSEAEKNTLNKNDGYNCYKCSSTNLWKCTIKTSCPSGFSTAYSAECVVPTRGSTCPKNYFSGISESPRAGCKDYDTSVLDPCSNEIWTSQYSGKYCNANGTRSTYVNYRCQKGYVGDEPCYSTSLVQYRTGGGAPEPCATLYSAKPDAVCQARLGEVEEVYPK